MNLPSSDAMLNTVLAIGTPACGLALAMTIANLRLLRPAPAVRADELARTDGEGGGAGEGRGKSEARKAGPKVSVCIPARNEEGNIEACVRSLLRGSERDIEVLVYNDHSTDRTGEILASLAAEDCRVKLPEVAPLPSGWNGKQFGCFRCGQAAAGQWLLFTDADVRFESDAVARTIAAQGELGAELISTFPRQITGTLAEKLAVPMIHFILLSYLPIGRMRSTADPSASAGCGQFLFVRRDVWLSTGGHSAFADSMHDGIKLPRLIRKAGFKTDLFDGTELCSVRMYVGLGQTWRGFAKNAYEGLGSTGLLVFVTVLHLCGHVAPWMIVGVGLVQLATGSGRDGGPDVGPPLSTLHWCLAAACIGMALVQRTLLARRFLQSPVSVALHSVGVLMMTLIQWHSLVLAKTGRRSWRGRVAGVAVTTATNG